MKASEIFYNSLIGNDYDDMQGKDVKTYGRLVELETKIECAISYREVEKLKVELEQLKTELGLND